MPSLETVIDRENKLVPDNAEEDIISPVLTDDILESSAQKTNLLYSPAKEADAQNLYATSILDLANLWYQDNAKPSIEEQEEDGRKDLKNDSEMLDAKEAKETMVAAQYAAVTGTPYDVSIDERRKLGFWALFEPALFNLFQAEYALTRNVNYQLL
ncbi:MAG: hypothetical protein AABX05_01060 [Nanoarchaeota archaeon]|mgnify:FL=1